MPSNGVDDCDLHEARSENDDMFANPYSSSPPRAMRGRSRRELLVLAFALLWFLLSLAVVLDLAIVAPTNKQLKLESLTLDASRRLPYAFAELEFISGSRLSLVQPLTAHCTFQDSGVDVEVHVTKIQQEQKIEEKEEQESSTTTNMYAVRASCAEEDLEAVAELLWEVLTRKSTARIGDVTCSVDLQVAVGHVMPVTYTHTVDIPTDTLLKGAFQQEPSFIDNNCVAATAPEDDPGFSFTALRHWGRTSLEVGVRVALPPRVACFVGTRRTTIRVIVPPATIHVEPSSDSNPGWVIGLDRLEATLSSNSGDSNSWAVFGIACNAEDCPWYTPLLELYSSSVVSDDGNNDSTTTIVITVDADGTFLETLLGRDHHFLIQFEEKELNKEQQHRQLLESITVDCMNIANDGDNDSSDFDSDLCWHFQLSEGFTLVSNVAIYDFVGAATADTNWDWNDSGIMKMDTTAVIEIGDGDDDKMNVIGNALLDWSDDSNIQVDMSFVNDGSWWPFRASIKCDGSFPDDLFTMTLNEANLNWKDDNFLTDAKGTLLLNLDLETFEASVTDPDSQFQIQGFLQDDEDLMGSSKLVWQGEEVWDAVLTSRLVIDGDDITVALEVIDPELQLSLNGMLLDEQLSGTSTCTFGGDLLWNSVLKGSVRTSGNTIPVSIEVIDFQQDFQIAGSGVGSNTDDVWSIVIQALTFRLDDDLLVNTKGQMSLDLDQSVAEIRLQDVADLDFEAEVKLRWTDYPSGVLDEASFIHESTSYVDIFSATFRGDADSGFVRIISNPLAMFELGVDCSYEYADITDAVTAQLKQLQIEWDDETYATVDGTFTIDFDDKFAQLLLEDSTELDFVAKFSGRWYSSSEDSTKLGGHLDEAIVTSGSETYLDTSGMFAYEETEGKYSGTLDASSAPAADMQMGMIMNLTWSDEDESLLLLVDHVHIGWEGTTYLGRRTSPVGGRKPLQPDDDSIPTLLTDPPSDPATDPPSDRSTAVVMSLMSGFMVTSVVVLIMIYSY